MDSQHRVAAAFAIDQHRDLDFAGCDDLDIDRMLGQNLKHPSGNAGVCLHPVTDDGDL
jgi:hypothetical protein